MLAVYERARDSLFALPASLIVGLGLMSWGARWVDGLLSGSTPWLLPTTVDSTRAILTTVATATITVAGIVFSMTAVVVQLATSQLSPRVTQGLLRDRYQQVTIGVSVGTFVYALLVLSDVHGTEERPFSNHDFSATLAVALGLVSMLLIVYFIDRTMRSMRIDTVVRRLADNTRAAIRELPGRQLPAETERLPQVAAGTTVAVASTGWVSRVDIHRILEVIPAATLVRIDLRSGDFITKDEVAARTWPEVDDATAEAIAAAIKVGRTRAISSDPSYGIRQMVDIALRALSPSLNDPTTGADVVRHMAAPLQALLLRELPGRAVAGEGGRRIYMPRVMSHSDYVHGAFREIRLNAGDQPHVLHALIETLASLIGIVGVEEHAGRAAALTDEIEATMAAVRHAPLPEADRGYLLDFARSVGIEP